jgi:hypothetical protein
MHKAILPNYPKPFYSRTLSFAPISSPSTSASTSPSASTSTSPSPSTASPPPPKKRVKKEIIPATLKNILWHTYFNTSITGLCQCCKVETISKAIFDAGHIISEKNGGKVTLENLKPICKLCNSSMGKTNMDEFMKKYGIP